MTEDTPPAPRGGFRIWMIVPGLGALMVVAVFAMGLQRPDIQRLPSALIDKPAPSMDLEPLYPGQGRLDDAAIGADGIKLINIWASWCGPCRAEHPHLMEMAEEGISLLGINYKDQPGNARAFLEELGDPYAVIGQDSSGRAGIELGVYGVPETFVVNDAGKIVYKHVGPILKRDVEKLRAAIAAAGT